MGGRQSPVRKSILGSLQQVSMGVILASVVILCSTFDWKLRGRPPSVRAQEKKRKKIIVAKRISFLLWGRASGIKTRFCTERSLLYHQYSIYYIYESL